jgi:hypothetical protein
MGGGNGNADGFLVKFISSGVRQCVTYCGGAKVDYGYSCATDASGNVYLAGTNNSAAGIATVGSHQSTYGGYDDAFLVKFDGCTKSYSEDTIVTNDSCTWIDGVTYTSSNNTATDILTASNGCDSIVRLNLTLILGLNNPAALSNVKVYPNPTNGKLTIDAENFECVELYDVSGRLINKSELKTIDLQGQSQGLYLLKINANGTKQELKVLKE